MQTPDMRQLRSFLAVARERLAAGAALVAADLDALVDEVRRTA
ncbi:hypothetical protein ABH926_009796 [Catenulispora sp. GP43]